MNDTAQPSTPSPPVRRSFRGDTIFLQWVRLPLLVALALVAAKAIQRPFEGQGKEHVAVYTPGDVDSPTPNPTATVAPNVTPTAAPSDIGPQVGPAVTPPVDHRPQPISVPIVEPAAGDALVSAASPLDPVEAAQSLGETVRFLRAAFRGSVEQLTQSGSQATYPLLQMKDWWLAPWSLPENQVVPQTTNSGASQAGLVPDSSQAGSSAGPTNVVSASALVFANPQSNHGPIRFLLDDQVVTLAAGEARQFAAGERIVQFDRGGRFGADRQVVAQGVFVFEVASRGWRLNHRDDLPAEVKLIVGP